MRKKDPASTGILEGYRGGYRPRRFNRPWQLLLAELSLNTKTPGPSEASPRCRCPLCRNSPLA